MVLQLALLETSRFDIILSDIRTWTTNQISFQYEKSDIGSANLYITHERTKHIAYTKPYHTDASCFFLKKDPPLPKWMDMIVLFQLETWVAALLTFIFCTIFLMIVYAIIDERKVYSIPIWMTAIIFDESIPFIQRIRFVKNTFDISFQSMNILG